MADRPVEIIAEVANAHGGDRDAALRIAKGGFSAGADAVKFQVYFADELLVRAHPRFAHFQSQAFAKDEWPGLIGALKDRGARVYCDVFGLRALEVAERSGADGFKVHTSDLGNEPLLEAVRATGKPVFLSSGGSTAPELAFSIRAVRQEDGPRLVLMHGFQSFPTAVDDSRLARIPWLRAHFGAFCDIGYQDHVDADDPFAVHVPLMAIAAGACVIEKHMTLDRAAKGVDYYSSFEPAEFARFVETVRTAESALAGDPQEFAPSERIYRRSMKKYWVSLRPLSIGHVLDSEDTAIKRVTEGPPNTVERAKLLGRSLRRDVPAEHPLSRLDVNQTVWALVVARMASTRMPGKALAEVAGTPSVAHLLDRLAQCETLDEIVLCTTTLAEDDPIARLAKTMGVSCHRGPVEDVLERMLEAVDGQDVDVVVRITGDDILVDPNYLDLAVRHHLAQNAEHTEVHALPSGTEAEIFDTDLLRTIHQTARDRDGTEYLTWYVTRNGDQFRRASLPVHKRHARDWRLTIDTPEDHRVVAALLDAMKDGGKTLTYRLDDIVEFFDRHPELLEINRQKSKRSQGAEVDTGLDWTSLVCGRMEAL